MSLITHEVNFDVLPGPTHNYAGLSYDNSASMESGRLPSNPRAAALQSLEKMKFMMDLGIKQAVLPPQERPYLPAIRLLGFTGKDVLLPEKMHSAMPEIFPQLCSSSFMWAANIATITPSIDSGDQHVHITPANLTSHFHRSIEVAETAKILKKIFADPIYFTHHDPLPPGPFFRDEGSANHTRFCRDYAESGIHLFVYGEEAKPSAESRASKFLPRQTREASEAIARQHDIYAERLLFARQHPQAIEQGIFHNDVIAVGNQNFFLFHEKAFLESEELLERLKDLFQKQCDKEMILSRVSEKEVPLKTAVRTYLFNSQIITQEGGAMCLIAPEECQREAATQEFLENLSKSPETPIRDVHYVALGESMRNGGGPACLRLRAVLNQKEFDVLHPNVLLTEKRYERLTEWVHRYYRDKMTLKDLRDPKLVEETQEALNELTRILDLGSIYSFQT